MAIEQFLLDRAKSKCELCQTASDLTIYNVPPVDYPQANKVIVICTTCKEQINSPDKMDSDHWQCLNDSMWSQTPAVQVMAWRQLMHLSSEAWANDLLEMLYLDDETKVWAETGFSKKQEGENSLSKDSNGTPLLTGDSVTLIKDLVVKGANFTAKRGTLVKNISLTDNPEQVEGRVNGTQIVLLTCFLKKAN